MASVSIPHVQYATGSPARRAIGWLLILVIVACLTELALIMVAGGPWRQGRLHVSKPLPRLGLAIAAWVGWALLRCESRGSRKEWTRLAGRGSLLIVGATVAWATAEIGLRVLLSRTQNRQSIDQLGGPGIQSTQPVAKIIQRSPAPSLIYELKSNLTEHLDMDVGHHVTVRTNKMGMRHNAEYATARAAHSVRILGVGDSGMFGWGVEQDQDYMSLLESNLNRRADGVLYEAPNLAVPGYNTQLEVECVRLKGLPLKPDVVVVGWCENDFQLPIFVPQAGQWTRTDVSFLYYLFFDRPKFGDVALTQVSDLRSIDQRRIPARFHEGVNIAGVRRAFQELKDLSDRQHFHVLVFGPMRAEVTTILRELDLPHFNTLERIREEDYPPDFRVHFMHPRAGGHRVLAEHLERELDARGWLRPQA